jgi:hypothetical protein
VDGTGSGSCQVVGFGVSGVEPWGTATGKLVVMGLMMTVFFPTEEAP